MIIKTKSTNVDSNSSETSPVEKKRGRPKGAIREAYFCMAAVNDGELIQEMIPVTRGEKVSEDEMRTEARKSFLKKHKVDAESEIGPLFEAKLTQASTSKRHTLRLSPAEINYTDRKIQAEYNGWQTIGRYIQDENGKENSEFVHLYFIKEVSPGEKKRAKPQPALKPISELKNIQELPATHASA